MAAPRSRWFVLLWALLPFLAALGGAAFPPDQWFVALAKPSWQPPNYLFGPVWSLLYLLMGVSLFFILRTPNSSARNKAIAVFSSQLALNFLWSIIFFKFHNPGLALTEIVLMWAMILWMIISFYRIDKTAALIQLPYIAWVSFATILNAAIFYLN